MRDESPSCCTYPMERRSCTGFNVWTSRPPTHTSPASAEIIRLNRRSSVVFPAPLSTDECDDIPSFEG